MTVAIYVTMEFISVLSPSAQDRWDPEEGPSGGEHDAERTWRNGLMY